MIVGVNCQPTDYPQHFDQLPKARICRVFAGPGQGLPDWSGSVLPTLPGHVIAHVSFKDWRDDCRDLVAWMDAMPAPARQLGGLPVRPVWLTYHHEPEGDMTPGEYRRRWQIMAAALDGHPKRAWVALVPIQTLQWTVNPLKGGGDPFTWWAGVGDYAAMDCYVDSWAATYPAARAFLAPLARLARGVGRQPVVPELGSVRLAGDADGTRRARWITEVAAALRAIGCAQMSWWCAPGSNGHDFHLSDAASMAAWRAETDR